ncbi:MAG: hypothetical protein JXX28_08555 [Deltaproteobacteria bacterium]|nr:hypothetical protein [Deltaproteobacteria bacterium]
MRLMSSLVAVVVLSFALACGGGGGGGGASLSERWEVVAPDVSEATVVSMTDDALVLSYADGDIQERLDEWGAPLLSDGWKVTYDSGANSDPHTTMYAKDGATLSTSALKSGGVVYLSSALQGDPPGRSEKSAAAPSSVKAPAEQPPAAQQAEAPKKPAAPKKDCYNDVYAPCDRACSDAHWSCATSCDNSITGPCAEACDDVKDSCEERCKDIKWRCERG